MGEWTILERLLEAAVQQHSTMIGRILLTVVVIFRILIVAIVGETVYEDEQTMFMCNTLQPGCNQACYDKAFPISHIRYWVFQIILVCTPSLCFITYSVHQAAKQLGERRCSFLQPLLEPRRPKANGGLGAEGAPKEEPAELGMARPQRSAKVKRQEGISRFYVIQVGLQSWRPALGPFCGQVARWWSGTRWRSPAHLTCLCCSPGVQDTPSPSHLSLSCPGGVQERAGYLQPISGVQESSRTAPKPSPVSLTPSRVPLMPGWCSGTRWRSPAHLTYLTCPSHAQVVFRRVPNPSPVPLMPRWCSGTRWRSASWAGSTSCTVSTCRPSSSATATRASRRWSATCRGPPRRASSWSSCSPSRGSACCSTWPSSTTWAGARCRPSWGQRRKSLGTAPAGRGGGGGGNGASAGQDAEQRVGLRVMGSWVWDWDGIGIRAASRPTCDGIWGLGLGWDWGQSSKVGLV
uniref:Uncharacterized protein n=1 Tax=Geospiza parvula TaxID=87175 RepID=A0A8U8C7U3_GEOPR